MVRRRIRRAACWSALFWGLGSSLFSLHLLRYLVRDLCHGQPFAQVSATIAWIIAAPRLIGVFRLFTPGLIDAVGHRKRFCIGCLLAAPVVLSGLPLLLPTLIRQSHESSHLRLTLVVLVAFWCLHHLIEYLGSVALMSWYGDLVPQRVRGRFFGRREAWMIAGMTVGMISLAVYSYYVIDRMPIGVAKWEGYLPPAWIGLGFLFLSSLPLTVIPDIPWQRQTETFVQRLVSLFAPLADRRFIWFVFFGCWVQMSQALTQGVQYGFSMRVIGITMLFSMLMSTETRIGQWLTGPRAGRLIDRLGTAPVMMTSLILAATGSLFYYFAEPETWWLLFGASTVWVFWVGVNIGISKTILDLAPPGRSAGYLAVYFTFATLTFGLFTLFGGHLTPKGFERISFLVSFELRLLAIPILWFVFRNLKQR